MSTAVPAPVVYVTVRGSDHDQGAQPVALVRLYGDESARTVRLMHDCGYRCIEVEAVAK